MTQTKENDFTGLFHIFGPHGVGKTRLALSAIQDKKNSVFIDGDSGKSARLVGLLGIDKYYDLLGSYGHLTEVEQFSAVANIIDELKPGRDVVIFDNCNLLFNGAHSYVAKNHPEFRQVWKGTAEIMGGIEWQTTRKVLLPAIYATLQKKARLVILITHEKPQREGAAKTGAMEPDSDPSLRLGANTTIRLAFSGNSAVPVGLVVKGYTTVRDGQMLNVLPKRIPNCTWQTMRGYLDSPIELREPTKEELPNNDELNLIHGALTEEQKQFFLYQVRLQMSKVGEEMALAVLEEAKGKNVDLINAAAIAANLKAQFPDITAKDVIEITNVTNVK